MIDIMDGRRDGSDLFWVFKDYESKIAYFNNYKSKAKIKHDILESKSLKYDLKLISDKTGQCMDELLKEACSILDGMSHNIGMNAIRFMGYTLSKIIKKIYHHFYVNADQMEKLRQAFVNSRVVLLPTHRSYADFLIMSYVMFQFDLPLPVIAAAMDFMNMRFVGELLRACGAFFIRRSFASDELYWAVFSRYIKALIESAQEPLEFFIEGTRSRTNKSLAPKFGMLGIVVEQWLTAPDDISVVPISISYDRVLEEKLYAWELLGVPKPRESTTGLLKVRHILDEKFGNIYFNIGDPLSLSQLANQYGIRRSDHNLQLSFQPRLFEREKQFLRQLAHLIVSRQQQCLIVPDWAVVVLILLHCALEEGQWVSLSRLVSLYQSMTSLMTQWGSLMRLDNNNASQCVDEALDLHKMSIVRQKGTSDSIGLMGCYDDGDVPWSDAAIVDRIHLGHCRNPILFHIARQSILINRIEHGPPSSHGSTDLIADDWARVVALMSREFIYGDEQVSSIETTIELMRSSHLLLPTNDGPNTTSPSYALNRDHPCLTIITSAIHVHLVAYAIYGHLYNADITPLSQLCSQLQKSVIGALRSMPKICHRWLELCSLDIVRNCVLSCENIVRSSGQHQLAISLACVNNCLSSSIRTQLETIKDSIARQRLV